MGKDENKLGTVLFVGVLVIIWLFIAFRNQIMYSVVYDGAKTKAKVESVVEKKTTSTRYKGKGRTRRVTEYEYDVRYTYIVDGVTYYGQDTLSNEVDEYDWIDIYYDQSNPAKSDAHESSAPLIIPLVVIAAVMFYGWKKKKKILSGYN